MPEAEPQAPFAYEGLDRIFHEKARLGIVSSLAAHADGLTFSYRVTGMAVVNFDESGIDAAAPGRNLVLATCWPFDALAHGSLRYVVHATMEPAAG